MARTMTSLTGPLLTAATLAALAGHARPAHAQPAESPSKSATSAASITSSAALASAGNAPSTVPASAATGPLVATSDATPPTPGATRWLGYQEVEGERTIPVLGTLKTRNRNWFVADRVPQPGGGFVLQQHTCDVAFDPVLGVQVRMTRALIEAMPRVAVAFERLPDGTFGARGWHHGWDAADLEGDGHPGATVTVEAPVCGGDLYVASDSLTRARAKDTAGGLDARLVVDVKQQILGASSDCLRQASSDTEERLQGWFRLVPAPQGDVTCARFNRADWPGR